VLWYTASGGFVHVRRLGRVGYNGIGALLTSAEHVVAVGTVVSKADLPRTCGTKPMTKEQVLAVAEHLFVR
jgi:hypothetical protein